MIFLQLNFEHLGQLFRSVMQRPKILFELQYEIKLQSMPINDVKGKARTRSKRARIHMRSYVQIDSTLLAYILKVGCFTCLLNLIVVRGQYEHQYQSPSWSHHHTHTHIFDWCNTLEYCLLCKLDGKKEGILNACKLFTMHINCISIHYVFIGSISSANLIQHRLQPIHFVI